MGSTKSRVRRQPPARPPAAGAASAGRPAQGAELPRRQFPSGTESLRRTLRRTSRGKIVGQSPLLAGVIETIDRIASTDCTVIVTGETGTGKEAVVAALHEASPRCDGPLVAVNCGALPEQLVESELFGHVQGAFTDARESREGRVAAAEGGTLFLDEIDELPLPLQVKILRLLQNREYRPIGGDQTLRSDVRFVAATNSDLAEEVRRGAFRQDLYYRLNVVTIHLPALRERLEDLEHLVEHFLGLAREVTGRNDLRGFSADAFAALRRHDWPGNIRELENVVYRAVLLGQGPEITREDVLPYLPAAGDREVVQTLPDAGIDLREAVRTYERSLVVQALARTGGNKTRAAELLGIQRTSLLEMIKRLRIMD